MSRRFLICIGTAVGLVLAAACGFLFGSSVRESKQDTEQSAYVSNWQDVSEDSTGKKTSQAISGGEAGQEDTSDDTAQTDSGGNTDSNGDTNSDADVNSDGDTNSGGDADSGGDTNSGGDMDSSRYSNSVGDTKSGADMNSDADMQSVSGNPVSSDAGDKYIVFAIDGSLVVFYSDAATVYFDSGIDVEHLPEETRSQVEQGITFESEEELFGFLESYSS